MKKLLSVIVLTFFLGLAPKAFAETSIDISSNGDGASSEVSVESSTGESTVCVNGHCTTTQNGGSSATVCINGTCETTEGDVNVQEGGVKVQVENDNNSNAPVVTQIPADQTPTLTPTSPITPSPQQQASDSAKQSEIKDPTSSRQEKKSAFEELMNTIRDFLNDILSQNK